jgi:hypothetical protein
VTLVWCCWSPNGSKAPLTLEGNDLRRISPELARSMQPRDRAVIVSLWPHLGQGLRVVAIGTAKKREQAPNTRSLLVPARPAHTCRAAIRHAASRNGTSSQTITSALCKSSSAPPQVDTLRYESWEREKVVNACSQHSKRPLHATRSVGDLVQLHNKPRAVPQLLGECRLTTNWFAMTCTRHRRLTLALGKDAGRRCGSGLHSRVLGQ